MLKRLAGALIAHADQCSVSEVAEYLLDLIPRIWQRLTLTHYWAANHLDGKYRDFSLGRLKRSLARGEPTNLNLAIFPTAGAAREAVEWEFRIAISRTGSRGKPCVLIGLGFGEQLVKDGTGPILQFSDLIATRFRVQSGNLHDLGDFSDQNALGPHWFKITGKTLDPRKIKYSTVLGEEVVDIEQNPCHLHVVGTIDFVAAWTVYLGRDFLNALETFDPDTLPGEVVKLEQDLYRATLFEDPFSATEAENVARLWEFRRRLRLDEIAHRYVSPLV